MRGEIVISLIAAIVWFALELRLIWKDKRSSQGTTTLDHRTRSYNSIASILALALSPLISVLPALGFASVRSPILVWAGILTMCGGLILRHWSIFVLGGYFRTTVELGSGQKVVRTGPYRLIRHPSYTGMILFCLGYGLIAQNWLSLVAAVTLPTAALLYRISIEESALVKGLGTEYEDYQKVTKKLIPLIW